MYIWFTCKKCRANSAVWEGYAELRDGKYILHCGERHHEHAYDPEEVEIR